MKPLAGKSVLVTRPRAQAASLVADLEALGAQVHQMPVIEIEPPESMEPLDDALQNLSSYDWVVLTSVNGVKAVTKRMQDLSISIDHLATRKLATIGPATADELAKTVRAPDLVPSEYVSEAIAEALIRTMPTSKARFLLARADIARKDLAHLLRAQGWEV